MFHFCNFWTTHKDKHFFHSAYKKGDFSSFFSRKKIFFLMLFFLKSCISYWNLGFVQIFFSPCIVIMIISCKCNVRAYQLLRGLLFNKRKRCHGPSVEFIAARRDQPILNTLYFSNSVSAYFFANLAVIRPVSCKISSSFALRMASRL